MSLALILIRHKEKRRPKLSPPRHALIYGHNEVEWAHNSGQFHAVLGMTFTVFKFTQQQMNPRSRGKKYEMFGEWEKFRDRKVVIIFFFWWEIFRVKPLYEPEAFNSDKISTAFTTCWEVCQTTAGCKKCGRSKKFAFNFVEFSFCIRFKWF